MHAPCIAFCIWPTHVHVDAPCLVPKMLHELPESDEWGPGCRQTSSSALTCFGSSSSRLASVYRSQVSFWCCTRWASGDQAAHVCLLLLSGLEIVSRFQVSSCCGGQWASRMQATCIFANRIGGAATILKPLSHRRSTYCRLATCSLTSAPCWHSASPRSQAVRLHYVLHGSSLTQRHSSVTC